MSTLPSNAQIYISSDQLMMSRLSSLVRRLRSAVTGTRTPRARRSFRFWTVSFTFVAYRTWRWWLATAVAFRKMVLIGFWVASSHESAVHPIGTPCETDGVQP